MLLASDTEVLRQDFSRWIELRFEFVLTFMITPHMTSEWHALEWSTFPHNDAAPWCPLPLSKASARIWTHCYFLPFDERGSVSVRADGLGSAPEHKQACPGGLRHGQGNGATDLHTTTLHYLHFCGSIYSMLELGDAKLIAVQLAIALGDIHSIGKDDNHAARVHLIILSAK